MFRKVESAGKAESPELVGMALPVRIRKKITDEPDSDKKIRQAENHALVSGQKLEHYSKNGTVQQDTDIISRRECCILSKYLMRLQASEVFAPDSKEPEDSNLWDGAK